MSFVVVMKLNDVHFKSMEIYSTLLSQQTPHSTPQPTVWQHWRRKEAPWASPCVQMRVHKMKLDAHHLMKKGGEARDKKKRRGEGEGVEWMSNRRIIAAGEHGQKERRSSQEEHESKTQAWARGRQDNPHPTSLPLRGVTQQKRASSSLASVHRGAGNAGRHLWLHSNANLYIFRWAHNLVY